jgi:membrane protease YdiL (CAAX protease family)
MSRVRVVFFGAEGLRHGWRFLLFVFGMWLAGRYASQPLFDFLAAQSGVNLQELSAPALIIGEIVELAEVLVVTGVAALLERRRIDSYGLPIGQAFGGLFWKGLLAGVAVIIFVGGAMVLSGAMQVHGLELHGTAIVATGLLWLVAMILVGLNEEYLFRGYALQALWRGAGFWPATLIMNALFAGAHVAKPHENAMDIGMICVLGVALCLSVRRTGSLWWAVGWHAAFDFGQFFLIGTRNGGQAPVGHLLDVSFPGPAWLTGGELGTEASVFMVPVAIAMFIYCGWLLPKRPQAARAAPTA